MMLQNNETKKTEANKIGKRLVILEVRETETKHAHKKDKQAKSILCRAQCGKRKQNTERNVIFSETV